MKRALLILMLTLSNISLAYAFGNTKDRIDGVTEFLIERANENYLYFFENSIRENDDLRCYFGKTVSNLELGGLKELMISSSLWKDSLKKDFAGIKNKSTVWVVSNSWGQIKKVTDAVTKIKPDTVKELEKRKLPAGNIKNLFTDDKKKAIEEAVKYFDKFESKNSKELKKKICKITIDHTAAIDEHLNTLISIKEAFVEDMSALDDDARDKVLTAVATVVLAVGVAKVADIDESAVNDAKQRLEELLKEIEEIKKVAKTFDTNKESDFTVKTIAAFDLLRRYTIESRSETSDRAEAMKAAQKNVDKIKRHVLFFAQVADAKEAKAVKGILEAYTLPAVSFYEKRDNSRHWFVSAYLGMTAAEPEDGSDTVYGEIYAPIGLEYAWGAPDMWLADSMSIMVAPFDFGYPVNLKLKGEEKDVDFDEIISPSISFNFGIENTPIAWGFIYQRGQAYDGSGAQRYRTSIHISFDMPLHVF